MAKVTVVVQTVLVVSVLMILTGCATSADPAAKPSWANVASPVAESTDPVLTENGEVNPGTYWAEVARVSGTSDIVFRITRVYFREECDKWAMETMNDNECFNDYGVQEFPDAYASISPVAKVSVADQQGPGTNLSVDTATIKNLVLMEYVNAPLAYSWVPFPFIVRVEQGTVVEAHQFWVP